MHTSKQISWRHNESFLQLSSNHSIWDRKCQLIDQTEKSHPNRGCESEPMGFRPGADAHRPVRHDIILQSTSLSVLYHFRCALSQKRHHLPSERLWKALFQRILMAVHWHKGEKNTRKSLNVTSPQENVRRVIQKSIALTNICNISTGRIDDVTKHPT